MQRIVFYLVYPILYALTALPFWALYFLSDVFYYLFWISGYRKKVVLENLRKSFPEKSEKEIIALAKAYYSYLCDLALETLKTLHMSERQARERCVYRKAEWLDKMYEEGKSILIVMGHYGNWEWGGPSFTLNTKYQLIVAYRQLSNPYFENMMVGMRTKFGTQIVPADKTLREMVANRKKVTATALIADQAAITANAYWTTFLNQDTNVYNGPEKLAVKFNYPVVYMNIRRIKRGYYELIPELLFENSAATQEGEILEKFTRRLEDEIKKDPVTWLWSHKRWKYQRN